MSEFAAVTSRRGFARLLGAGAAVATLRSLTQASGGVLAAALPEASEPARVARGPILLNANENPYGPPPAALAAIRDALGESCRYPDHHAEALREALAGLHGVSADQIVLGAGSSQILHAAAAACSGPDQRVLTADPTFESLGRYASLRKAAVTRVPLTADFRHDLPAMLSAANGAGLIYICNPNNPTASLTPAAELTAFLEHVPPSVTVLVDEAYHHYAEGLTGYASTMPLVARFPNLIVARTFSKIYGMAGLRCGYSVASKALSARLAEQTPYDSLGLPALVAARVALTDKEHIERSRTLNAKLRAWTSGELEKAGAPVIPSAANFLMAELGHDVTPTIQAMRGMRLEVGRRFPALPTHLRVTIGTEDEMRTFVEYFHRVWQRAAA
ncbi:MAG: aminotransferase class I/II-fold pyridoxal phosphate-dependent enzyme [Acidobacteriota bacterium]